MNLEYERLSHHTSCVKIISAYEDSDIVFLVGSNQDFDNIISLCQFPTYSDYFQFNMLDSCHHKGGVTDIQYNMFHKRILTCSSTGTLCIYEINEEGVLQSNFEWNSPGKAPLTGAIFYDDRILCISETGDIMTLELEDQLEANTLQLQKRNSKGCLTCVESLNEGGLFCVGSSQMTTCLKVYDERVDDVVWSGKGEGVVCLSVHPGMGQNRIMGGIDCDDSKVAIWDVRGSPEPLSCHELELGNGVYSLKYKPDDPSEVWVGTFNAGLVKLKCEDLDSSAMYQNDLVLGESKLSVDSLDVSNHAVIGGSDKETLCLLKLSI